MFFLGWFLSNRVSGIALNKKNALVSGLEVVGIDR